MYVQAGIYPPWISMLGLSLDLPVVGHRGRDVIRQLADLLLTTLVARPLAEIRSRASLPERLVEDTIEHDRFWYRRPFSTRMCILRLEPASTLSMARGWEVCVVGLFIQRRLPTLRKL